MTPESLQNMTEAEDLQLPTELVYERVVRKVDRHDTVNHLAMYVLRRWKRTIPKIPFRPTIWCLEPICSMPVEILYEILEYLHPIDLYHICQANRAFQALLSHPNSSSVWTIAFENNPAIPKCPPETLEFPTKMSGLEWAGMLFGKHICRECGEGGSPPNITFRHFRCADCSNGWILSKAFGLLSPSVSLADLARVTDREPFIYTLVKKSQELRLSQGGDLLNTSDQFYTDSKAELIAAYEAVTEYKDAIMRKEPGAMKAFRAYRARRKAKVDGINKHAAICLRWAEELRKCYMEEMERTNSKIMKRIRNRYRRLGHHPDDIEKATFEYTFYTNASNLSNKRWRTTKALLEPAIIQAKNERWARERKVFIQRRKDSLHELYREYKKTVPPLTWAYLPPHYAVYEFKPFAELINALHDDELDKDCYKDALRCLPKEIEDWMVAKKKQLVSLLPGRGNGATISIGRPSQLHLDVGPSSSMLGSLHEPLADFNALQLATSVFCCLGTSPKPGRRKTGLCLIGWEVAGPHLRCSCLQTSWERRLHFSQRGHDAATALLNLACLDPRTATTTDMDRLDYRYICTSCPVVACGAFGAFYGRAAYNWRDAVLHYIKKTDGTHPIPTWNLLTTAAEAYIKCREGPDPYIFESSWSCTLCPEHFKNLVTRNEAVKHVKFKHNIHAPVERTHFFYLITRDDRTLRRQAGFPRYIRPCDALRNCTT